MLVHGFEPIAGNDARIVILGTLPGADSVRLHRYYANPRNAFWYIIQQLFGIDGSYEQRCQGLVEHRIALWDVLAQAERNGSSDRSILKGSEVPNDFAAFFHRRPLVETVFFNGGPAECYFRTLVLRGSPPMAQTPRQHFALPSSSPANSHMTREAKIEAWQILKGSVEHD